MLTPLYLLFSPCNLRRNGWIPSSSLASFLLKSNPIIIIFFFLLLFRLYLMIHLVTVSSFLTWHHFHHFHHITNSLKKLILKASFCFFVYFFLKPFIVLYSCHSYTTHSINTSTNIPIVPFLISLPTFLFPLREHKSGNKYKKNIHWKRTDDVVLMIMMTSYIFASFHPLDLNG